MVRGRYLRAVLLAGVLAMLASRPAQARTTIVPDDFPTIQAALDSIGLGGYPDPETLLVRAGEYPEVIEVHHELVIRGADVSATGVPAARIQGLRACYQDGGVHIGQRYENLHILEPVVICGTNGPVDISFRDCRFDAEVASDDMLNYPDLTQISLRHCKAFGPVSLRAQLLYADSSEFRAPLWLNAEEWAEVRDSRFQNVSGAAITVNSREASIVRNLILGATTGIVARMDGGDVHVEDNQVEGCVGDGIHADAGSYLVYMDRNRVSLCGGVGIRAIGLKVARGNRVIGCETGLALHNYEEPAIVFGNVVGRCVNGIVVIGDGGTLPGELSVSENTAYACSGSDLVLQDQLNASVHRNLSCFNAGAGLAVMRGVPPSMSCNNWFANEAGARMGVSRVPSDFALDPLFCDIASDDVRLQSASPLLDVAGCGQIGAYGLGCESPPVPVSFELPSDALPPVWRERWLNAWLEPADPFTAADVDIATVRLNDVVVPSPETSLGDHDLDGTADLELTIDRFALSRILNDGDEVVVTITGRMGNRDFVGSDTIRVRRPAGDLWPPVPRGEVLSIRALARLGVADRLAVAFTLNEASPARIEVLDVLGRVVLARRTEGLGAGEHQLELGAGGFAQGIYFLRIRQGMSEARSRIVFVR
jgi:hypothetical protein